MSFLSFILQNKWIILFYLLIIVFIVVKRKKFQFQAKFIALYRTKFGLKFIDRIGTKHSEFIKILGYMGIGIGYVGMITIIGFIVKGIVDLILNHNAPAVIAPVIPGIPIPGSPIFVPFWYGIIALFIVVLIHEFSHGIVSRAHGIPVHNSGIVFFGPLIGAFVEPDEKKLQKQSDVVKYSVFAAGPWSNVITAALALLILSFVFNPAINAVAQPTGFSFLEITSGMPAEIAGLEAGVVYNKVNNIIVLTIPEFAAALGDLEAGETVLIGNDDIMYSVIAIENPEAADTGIIGVQFHSQKNTHFTNQNNVFVKLLIWFNGLFTWIFILSLGLGLANLLPLGPVDGGRMIQISLEKIIGKKKGDHVWKKITLLLIIVLVILLIVPILRVII
ncbi:MAG: site-2 protease family protein [Nanoarchaeota archaeon]|nr:site-2 protease family protein [Nanoarchaeota archaeon]MBU1321226.1 site-2 protease family protein [Nanoarchaeota archaeon]MBU1597031.1 site-2 protease family protein [Nanoarchaeota archaeon]MBU2441823.1 site-2 protease family protein [Nanoarchaeota archaeon]